MDVIDNVADQFQSSELVLIAEQCGLAPISRWGPRQLIEAIFSKLDKDGIPEPPTGEMETLQRSELLLEDFLYVAGYIDGQGNPVDRKVASTKLPLQDYLELHNIPKTPDCYSYADDRDPGCGRCMIYLYCAEQRLSNLPPCFAVLWDNKAPECGVCLEAAFCKEAVMNRVNNKQEVING